MSGQDRNKTLTTHVTDDVLAEKRHRILIVDDVPVNRESLTMLFEDRFDVVTAENGEEAIKIAQQTAVDVVLLDVMMPRMNGFQVLHRLRKTWNPVELPVIILTSVERKDYVPKALQLGANDYVTKPVGGNEIMQRVLRQLQNKRQLELFKSHMPQLFEPGSTLILYVFDYAQALVFDTSKFRSMTIGRVDPETDNEVDLDLAPFGAQQRGVSRGHATLIWDENALALVDDGSVNGTCINGQRLTPGTPHPIRDHDLLLFGFLQMQALRAGYQ